MCQFEKFRGTVHTLLASFLINSLPMNMATVMSFNFPGILPRQDSYSITYVISVHRNLLLKIWSGAMSRRFPTRMIRSQIMVEMTLKKLLEMVVKSATIKRRTTLWKMHLWTILNKVSLNEISLTFCTETSIFLEIICSYKKTSQDFINHQADKSEK